MLDLVVSLWCLSFVASSGNMFKGCVIISFYRSPSADTIFMIVLLADAAVRLSISLIQQSDRRTGFLVMGDFNCHYSDWLGSHLTIDHGSAAYDFASELNLSQLVPGPTHQAGGVLDLVLTDVPELTVVNVLPPLVALIIHIFPFLSHFISLSLRLMWLVRCSLNLGSIGHQLLMICHMHLGRRFVNPSILVVILINIFRTSYHTMSRREGFWSDLEISPGSLLSIKEHLMGSRGLLDSGEGSVQMP